MNFTQSIEYSPQLENASAKEFREVSEAVVEKVCVRESWGWGFSVGGGQKGAGYLMVVISTAGDRV